LIFRYNKSLVYHLVLTVIAYIIFVQLWGWSKATFVIALFCVITTFMFNCYRIDIKDDGMIVFQLYGGKTNILWDDVDLIEIGQNTVEMPILGVVRNMTIKINEKEDIVINIEPVYRNELIDEIQCFVKLKKY